MKKLFFRYFLSIFSITVITLCIQTVFLVSKYRISQESWKKQVYEDFVAVFLEDLESSDYFDFGMSNMRRFMTDVTDPRISGLILRNSSGQVVMVMGNTPGGKVLAGMFPGMNTLEYPAEKVRVKSRIYNTRLNITSKGDDVVIIREDGGSEMIELDVPSAISATDVIGSVSAAFEGEDIVFIDILTHSPMTYTYSRQIIIDCLNSLVISVPVCLVIALAAAWIIGSRQIRHISSIRNSLTDLSHGKRNVPVEHSKNGGLEEIASAIEELDAGLQANEKSRSAWLNSISHDLNTPAASIKLLADGMADGIFEPSQENISALQKESDSLNSRISRVIEYSSLQAAPKPVLDAVDAVMFASDAVSLAGLLERTEISVTADTILCNAALMQRACAELLNNAASASDGAIKFTVSADEETYSVCVENSGKLPEGMRDRDLLEPWARGDGSRTSGGNGLGLSIAASIASLHGGDLTLEQSTPDTVTACLRWPRSQ